LISSPVIPRVFDVAGGAGRPADMAKNSQWRTDFGCFRLRLGSGFAGLDGRKDCAAPGPEKGESKSRAKGFPVPFCSSGASVKPQISNYSGLTAFRPMRSFYSVGIFDFLSLKSLRTKLGLRAVWITNDTTTWPEWSL
jgi:hypothetical protein